MEEQNSLVRKSKLLQVRIGAREEEMLGALCERLGSKQSEFLRSLIREKFLKVFPRYAIKKGEKDVLNEPELTPEQACEQAGGKVVTKDGVQMCEIQLTASMKRYVPLSKPELFKK